MVSSKHSRRVFGGFGTKSSVGAKLLGAICGGCACFRLPERGNRDVGMVVVDVCGRVGQHRAPAFVLAKSCGVRAQTFRLPENAYRCQPVLRQSHHHAPSQRPPSHKLHRHANRIHTIFCQWIYRAIKRLSSFRLPENRRESQRSTTV